MSRITQGTLHMYQCEVTIWTLSIHIISPSIFRFFLQVWAEVAAAPPGEL